MATLEVSFERPFRIEYFERPTAEVASSLLGAVLARRDSPHVFRAARIVETEAYVAGDPANHAMRGPTRKNWTMFTGPGHLYIYRIHQVHCANVTTAPGEAVLLRAAEPLTEGLGNLNGPGLLCRAFSLTRAEDGLNVTCGDVRLLPSSEKPPKIRATRRVGIRVGQEALLRFVAQYHLTIRVSPTMTSRSSGVRRRWDRTER